MQISISQLVNFISPVLRWAVVARLAMKCNAHIQSEYVAPLAYTAHCTGCMVQSFGITFLQSHIPTGRHAMHVCALQSVGRSVSGVWYALM